MSFPQGNRIHRELCHQNLERHQQNDEESIGSRRIAASIRCEESEARNWQVAENHLLFRLLKNVQMQGA
jgi:hypothetical protein